jgi:two-component system, chemotaxis family, CheB/CheR fusion protein
MALPVTQNPEDGSLRPLRILLVENHEDTLHYLTRHLEESGHTVTPAGTVTEALIAARRSAPEVLLCDINLPDGSGWDIPAAIRNPRGPALCIAISGYVLPSEMQRSLDSGFHHHLVKPFVPRQLDALLAHARR